MTKHFCIALYVFLCLIGGDALAAGPPQIWFQAEPPTPLGPPNPTGGAFDYVEFLTSTNGWERASHVISVVEINSAWMEKVATADQLQQIVQTLGSRNIKIALELNGLQASGECKGGGFASRDPTIPIRKLVAAGGTVDYVVLNEPYAWAVVSNVTNGRHHVCGWSPEETARQLQPFINSVHQLVPKAEIGDAEPLWQNIRGRDLVNWTDTFARVTGTRFAFFHMDFDFIKRARDWPQEAAAMQARLAERGILFGTYIFGNRSDASDRAWLDTADGNRRQLKDAGVVPDHIIFASWHPIPHRTIPESDPDTFMAFVLRSADSP